MLVLIFCLAPVFSAGHEKGTAGILLSTKHGQRKLVYAKGLAAYCFGFCHNNRLKRIVKNNVRIYILTERMNDNYNEENGRLRLGVI